MDERRVQSRRNGLFGLAGVQVAVIGMALAVPPGPERSAKVNATILACGVLGLLVGALYVRLPDLSDTDKLGVGVLLPLSLLTLAAVDYSGQLIGAVATPLLMGIGLISVMLVRSFGRQGS